MLQLPRTGGEVRSSHARGAASPAACERRAPDCGGVPAQSLQWACTVARSRISSAWLFLWAGLFALSLHPLEPVARVVDGLLVPLRWVAELGSPLTLLGARSVAAAERELALAAPAEAAEGAETLRLLAEGALPADPALRAGRHFVPAEVVGRPLRDECWVVPRERAGIARGVPVVCGDAFVGRVLEVREGPPLLVRVQLVTERGFRIGAEVRASAGEAQFESEAIFLTVGGVRVPRRGDPRTVRLAAHQPSSSALSEGVARVHELLADSEDREQLAEGFRLGQVRREGERGDLWVEPELDYLDGLFQVALVVPESAGDRGALAAAPALEDGQWLATRALTAGDPAPWRSTLKIPLGSAAGLRAGAAVSGAGARLIGRVLRTGIATSDVALLDDPGFTLVAIARIEGLAEPRILGRLTTLGRGPAGTIRVRWWVRVPLVVAGADEIAGSGESGGTRSARLFSGSGEPGLPGGLFLGSTELPLQAQAGEELELTLTTGVEPARLRTLFVRRELEGQQP